MTVPAYAIIRKHRPPAHLVVLSLPWTVPYRDFSFRCYFCPEARSVISCLVMLSGMLSRFFW